MINVIKSHNTPYHAMGNGLCERFNRTLLWMMGTLDKEQKNDWKEQVSAIVHAYSYYSTILLIVLPDV